MGKDHGGMRGKEFRGGRAGKGQDRLPSVVKNAKTMDSKDQKHLK